MPSPRTCLLLFVASGAILAALGGFLAYLRKDAEYTNTLSNPWGPWDEPEDGVQGGHAILWTGFDKEGNHIFQDSWCRW